MIKSALSCVLFLCSFATHASLRELAKEFLQRNSVVAEAKSKIVLAQLDIESWSSSKSASLKWDSNYDNNKLESYSAFAAQFAGGAFRLPIATQTHAMTLAKDFSWGGNLSFENSFNKIQARGTTVFGFTQGLTFSQNIGRDFFGQNYKLQGKALESALKASVSQSQGEIDQSLLTLIQKYYSASLYKSTVKLQKEARKRAERRLALIKRRVRDGLREKVDLIQARISLLKAEESVKSAQQNLISNLESLATSVHREVDESDIVGFTESHFKIHPIMKGEVKENQDLQAIKYQVEALEQTLRSKDNDLMPEINFKAGVKNNNYDPKLVKGISGGAFGNSNSDVSVGVNVVWPFGSKPQKVEETKARVKFETARLKKDRLEVNIHQIEKSIKDQIKVLEENLKSSKSRLKLAQSALKEYSFLYERGRADLDQLIASEETLIQTQISHVQYLSQREQLTYQLSYVYGQLSADLVGQGVTE